jgi:D-alanyl-D-alanine carboxypeptidase
MAPYSYNLSTAGTHTIYAWAKDAVGNVSKPKSASVNIIVVDTGTKTDGVAIFFKGVWYIDTNGNGMWDGAATDTLYPDFGHGLSDAMPVTGDWDDTGVVRVGVFSNGSWYLDMKGDGVWDGGVVDKVIPNFGQGLPNAIPVTGDWNGSGTTKIGVFSNGSWYLDMKGDGVWDGGVVDKVIPNFGQGLPNAIPVTGDWNNSGTTKIGVFSNGSWYLDMKGDGDWDGGAVDKVILDFGTRLNGAIPVIMKNK